MSSTIPLRAAQEAACALLNALSDPALPPAECIGLAVRHILAAIERVDAHRRQYSCAFACPRCLRQYRINISLRGRRVTCVGCGHKWRAPEPAERN